MVRLGTSFEGESLGFADGLDVRLDIDGGIQAGSKILV